MNSSRRNYWLAWAAQGVIGLIFHVPLGVVALVLLVTGALLYERGQRTDQPGKSTERGYHSQRAATVLILGFDLVTVALLLIDAYGPTMGLRTFGAQFAVVIGIACVYMLVYQGARRRWPAGSD